MRQIIYFFIISFFRTVLDCVQWYLSIKYFDTHDVEDEEDEDTAPL